MKGKLILEDGSVFTGDLLNEYKATGEVVFNTGMTGYQEILTDPSYCSQIVTLTFPLIGNYGVADKFMQSRKSFVNGFIIGELCDEGSNWQKENELAKFLNDQKIPCLYNVDTRAVTRTIRSQGCMKGIIVSEDASQEEIDKLMAVPIQLDVVAEVTTPETYVMDTDGPHVVVMDFGIKQNILNSLHNLGCKLTVVPADTKADEIMAMNPDGIFLSNGPGDPKDVPEVIEEVKKLIGKKPMFGICLGHQLISLALGANTYKLKFGHRGSNPPVKNLLNGRVHISSQNHGYAVEEASLKELPLEVTHINVNDGTVEGMRHTSLPLFSVQYHPEASPGPDDNMYLFDQFWKLLTGETKGE
ncbi:MAG: glutamine-hydrolyzing carbamoyl-phosphate synthase small subunit [Anaerovibrio sp.]|uniref:glutamine-hydrolyzing carbamoyl-phosphate synthase small subunit n=1 Tax=Anaerovibrio sp. TaxID=1872532 RepID=UPI001B13E819|nr:glutamine-hydrolyzing carbamoyl-phosphate synthase small subunit [Anaerovibrio sp.]MBO6245197.1 glutamine-hydrolyzing carbamoyl-phosphate synthase small subunit [Anaerovibrio sp.]